MASTLEIKVIKCTFAKSLNYFLSLQLNDGEKLRTEVADATNKPVFKNNTFKLRTGPGEEVNTIKIGGFLIIRKDGDTKAQPSLLGSGEVNLIPLKRQLAGGKTVLCDDIPLHRKSKKQEQVDIIVGKVQLSIRAVDTLNFNGSIEPEASLHPDTNICNIVIHSIHSNTQEGCQPPLRADRCLCVEGRVISEQAHFQMIDWRKNPSGKNQLLKIWPRPIWQSSTRTQAHCRQRSDGSSQYDWNENDVFRIEPRMSSNNKGIRLDLVETSSPDGYNSPTSRSNSKTNITDWESRGGATLALGFLRKLHQYNLGLRFTPELAMNVSLELQPSFNEDWNFFDSQRGNQRFNLRRIHINIGGVTSSLPFLVHDCIVRISGSRRPPDEILPKNLFIECQPQILQEQVETKSEERTLSNNVLKEAHVALESYPIAIPFKITGSTGPVPTKNPQWDTILEFNAQDESFMDTVYLEFYQGEDYTKFAEALIDVHGLSTDGKVHEFYDVPLRMLANGKQHSTSDKSTVLASQPSENVENENSNAHIIDNVVGSEPSCQVNVRIWDCDAYLMHLNNVLEERPSGSARTMSVRTGELSEIELLESSSRSANKSLENGNQPSEMQPPVPRLQLQKSSSNLSNTTKQPLVKSNTALQEQQIEPLHNALRARKEGKEPEIEFNKPESINGTVYLKSPRMEDRPSALKLNEPSTPELSPALSRASTPQTGGSQQGGDQQNTRQNNRTTIDQPEIANSSLQESYEVINNSQIKPLQERLAIVTSDLHNKQTLIDKLLEDIDKRSEAIRVCGREIVDLRKANEKLAHAKDIAEAKLRAIENENAKDAVALAQEVQGVSDVDDLRRRVVLLSRKYASERKRNQGMMERLDRVQIVVDEHRSAVQELEELERAHQAQARFIQELQDENAQLQLFQATIKTQEKVIVKLENLLESKLREHAAVGTSISSTILIEKEMEELRSRNKDLEEKLLRGDILGTQGFQEKIKELESELEAVRTRTEGNTENVVDDKIERIEALEEQLVQNAKKFAKEISEVRMKLFEYEALTEDF